MNIQIPYEHFVKSYIYYSKDYHILRYNRNIRNEKGAKRENELKEIEITNFRLDRFSIENPVLSPSNI